ncbi:DUF4910 domain-containing protein [Desertimonas flava]|uniref:DUF4910 domain-containing protein n=1 Tax=Desertimonas flava TaxID=2064846 RepID=UPI000E348D61|nr:DUF4910 domain-containing protein [Desertimonas flava]
MTADPFSVADAAMRLVEDLYPICRSITGDGVRESLRLITEVVPLEIHEIPSGTPVLDWTIPPEWNVRDAYIADAGSGERVIDFRSNNLHIVSYSEPISARMTLDELRPHLHTLPDQPEAVPYRTSYYTRAWGFCLSQQDLDNLPDGDYDVMIDSSLEPGSLTYGEAIVPGATEREILVSSHVCHPSLADDNLSGIAVAALLARRLLEGPQLRHTVRFIFAPGTIGTIAWLDGHRDELSRIAAGLTLTCLGDDHDFTYKRTVTGDALVDQAASIVLRDRQIAHQMTDFSPYGYDERQYNSPGFRVPVGSLMRGRHGTFPEYHTSLDNLLFVSGERMAESLDVVAGIVEAIDKNRALRNLEPFGEPQLGARGLYGALGGTTIADAQLAMLWVLNLSDGEHSLLDIAARSGLSFESVEATALLLEDHGLLGPALART